MTMTPSGAGAPNLIERVQNILLKPQSEWERIDGEEANVSNLYMGYVLPLAVAAAIAGFIGTTLIGNSVFGVTYRAPMVSTLVYSALQVAITLAMLFAVAMVTNALAPNFGSTQNQGQAHKLIAYGTTATLVGGLVAIFPPLTPLVWLALIYSMVLVWIGLPRLMKTPEDKRVGYFATIVVVWIVLGLVMFAVLGSLALTTGGLNSLRVGQSTPTITAPSGSVEGSVTLPGGGTLDLSQIEQMGQAMSEGGAGAATDPTQLAARLPQALPGGFALVSSSSGAAMGAANAEAVYQSGNARLTVTVTDLGAMGAVAAMAGAANVQQNRQDADGYERVQTVNGRMITEEVSAASGRASYGIVGRGVAITAEGSGGASIEQVRSAVEQLNIEQLERDFGA